MTKRHPRRRRRRSHDSDRIHIRYEPVKLVWAIGANATGDEDSRRLAAAIFLDGVKDHTDGRFALLGVMDIDELIACAERLVAAGLLTEDGLAAPPWMMN